MPWDHGHQTSFKQLIFIIVLQSFSCISSLTLSLLPKLFALCSECLSRYMKWITGYNVVWIVFVLQIPVWAKIMCCECACACQQCGGYTAYNGDVVPCKAPLKWSQGVRFILRFILLPRGNVKTVELSSKRSNSPAGIHSMVLDSEMRSEKRFQAFISERVFFLVLLLAWPSINCRSSLSSIASTSWSQWQCQGGK